jgi:hypothetical protein
MKPIQSHVIGLIVFFLSLPSAELHGFEWVKKRDLSEIQIWAALQNPDYRGAYRSREKTVEEIQKGPLLEEKEKNKRLRAIMSFYSHFSEKDIRITSSKFSRSSQNRQILAQGFYRNWRDRRVFFLLKLVETEKKFSEILLTREFRKHPTRKKIRSTLKNFRELLKRW